MLLNNNNENYAKQRDRFGRLSVVGVGSENSERYVGGGGERGRRVGVYHREEPA